jgi:hypothetical protein
MGASALGESRMFDEAIEKRFDRFERETARRKRDSTVMTAAQRSQFEQATAPVLAPGAGSERPLFDLLSERFDRLERANYRLEYQIQQLEHGHRVWRRALAVGLAPALLLVGWSLYGELSRARPECAARADRPVSAPADPRPKAPASSRPGARIAP